MAGYLGNAVVSTLEGPALLDLTVAAARRVFEALADECPASIDATFGGPLTTWSRAATDARPEPERFGATLLHAPSFGIGTWRWEPGPGEVPGRDSVEASEFARRAAGSIHPLRACLPMWTREVLGFAEGVRRRQAFFLAFEAGLAAGTPAVFTARADQVRPGRLADLERVCPKIDEPGAFSIFLQLASSVIQAEAGTAPDAARPGCPDAAAKLEWLEERLRAAARVRAGALSEDALLALNALLVGERWLAARRVRWEGLFDWMAFGASVDFTRPEEMPGPRAWLLECPCPHAAVSAGAKDAGVEPPFRRGYDPDDRWPPGRRPEDPGWEARLGRLEAEARALEESSRTQPATAWNRQRRLLFELQSLGLLGTEAHPEIMPLAPPVLRRFLREAGERWSILSSYAEAAAVLERYHASGERAALVSDPAPQVVTDGWLAIDWFRRGPLLPPGHTPFSWTAVCERAMAEDGGRSDPILIREGGRWYRLETAEAGGRRVLTGVRVLDRAS